MAQKQLRVDSYKCCFYTEKMLKKADIIDTCGKCSHQSFCLPFKELLKEKRPTIELKKPRVRKRRGTISEYIVKCGNCGKTLNECYCKEQRKILVKS